ncbi:uncharacterized protein LOC131045558 isoform X2 [Cryptomeria japonica]|uniref:uncharacterized protein LOC131045558 isoform X2 n=1 Tax=Cryptomeria japonica TaxID=3369 RepID=UPI0027DAAB2A|nr:uncharacterized protein LOC131045558 isoform X2 [Cryptomeria japonica]
MANALTTVFHRFRCVKSSTLTQTTSLLFTPKLSNHSLSRRCLRSYGYNASNGGLHAREVKWRNFRYLGNKSTGGPFKLQVRAVEGGGYRGAGGFSGGGGGGGDGGGGDGMNNDDGSVKKTNSFLSWYMMLLEKYPVVTKAVTSALLTFFGDLFCQFVIEKTPELDGKRIFMFTLLGLVLVGPTLHFWYLSLSKLVSGTGASSAGLRLLLDQFLFAPTFIGIFFCSLLTLEGRTSDILPKLKQWWQTGNCGFLFSS